MALSCIMWRDAMSLDYPTALPNNNIPALQHHLARSSCSSVSVAVNMTEQRGLEAGANTENIIRLPNSPDRRVAPPDLLERHQPGLEAGSSTENIVRLSGSPDLPVAPSDLSEVSGKESGPGLEHARSDTSNARQQRRRICGLSPRTFWIALLVAIILVAAAVAGGVGGALSNGRGRKPKTEGQTR